MSDKLPTLTDLPSAARTTTLDALTSVQRAMADTPADEVAAALAPADAPEGYWVQAVDKAGRRSTRTFRRYDDTFTAGEAVVPARETIEFEGGLNGAARPRRLAVDVYRDDFGYRVIPIPPGTPLVASADVERFKGQGAIR